jgi:hypothetical protein
MAQNNHTGKSRYPANDPLLVAASSLQSISSSATDLHDDRSLHFDRDTDNFSSITINTKVGIDRSIRDFTISTAAVLPAARSIRDFTVPHYRDSTAAVLEIIPETRKTRITLMDADANDDLPTTIPGLHDGIKYWFSTGNRFWIEPGESSQKKHLGSKIQHAAAKRSFELVTRSPIVDPASTIFDYAYTFVMPRDYMELLLHKFKAPNFIRAFRNKGSRLRTAPGTIFIVFDDEDKKKMLPPDSSFDLIFHTFFKEQMESELSLILGRETKFHMQMTVLLTDYSDHQDPHIDEDNCLSLPPLKHPFIIHIPLGSEGRVIRLWDPNVKTSKHYGVPFGSGLVLPAKIYHAGCYCRTSGNMGLVLKFTPVDSAASVAHLQKPLSFSATDKIFNDNNAADDVHRYTFDRFHGYRKFTRSYLNQLEGRFPTTSHNFNVSNVVVAPASSNPKRKSDQMNEE